MKLKLFFKSTFRQPFRALLLFFIIGLVAFMTVSRACEYIVVGQETEKLSSFYRPIGTFEALADDCDLRAAIDFLNTDPRVSFVDDRRYTSGVIQDDIYNPYYDGSLMQNVLNSPPEGQDKTGLYNNDLFFYGTLKNVIESPTEDGMYELVFAVDEVVVGYPDLISTEEMKNNRTVRVSDEYIDEIADMPLGERYFVRARFDPIANDIYVTTYKKYQEAPIDLVPLTDGGDLLTTAPEDIDLDADAYSDLRKEINMIYDNTHALAVETTVDMSAIPDFQESMRMYYISDGRVLNSEDNEQERRVCVINAYFAEARGLQVGDTLTLELRNLPSEPAWGYTILKDDIENYGNYETQLETFEIVGIYDQRGGIYENVYTAHENHIYIPESVLNENFKKLDSVSFVSYVLKSPKGSDDFLAETKDVFAELGVKTSFMDTNYANFQAVSDPMLQSSLTNACLYSGLSLLVLAIMVFIYFMSRRRDLAISRAIGASKAKSAVGSALPLCTIALFGILAGGAFAWQYTAQNISENLTKFTELGLEVPDTTLGIVLPLLIAACIFAVLIVMALIGGSILAGKPVIELLQGGSKTREK